MRCFLCARYPCISRESAAHGGDKQPFMERGELYVGGACMRKYVTFQEHSRKQSSNGVQGYLAHKKRCPPMTLQQSYAQGSTVVLGGGCCFL